MKRQNYISPFLVFIAAFVWFLLGANFGLNIYDEGIGIIGAKRILMGEVPYRDFWTIYSPLWYYVLGLWIKLFGNEIFAIRLLTILLNSISISILYNTIKSQNINPYLGTLAALMFLSISPFYGRAIPLALLLVFLTIYLLLNKRKDSDYVIIGILAALIFSTRHDFGIYAIASTICVAIFENRILKEKRAKQYLIYLTTLLFVLCLNFLFLHKIGSLGGYFEYAYKFVFEKFGVVRSLPFPNPFIALFEDIPITSRIYNLWLSVVFYLPFVLIGILFYLIIKSKIEISSEGKFFVTVTLFSLIFSAQGMVRSGYEHILPSLLIIVMLITPIMVKLNLANKFYLLFLLIFFSFPPIAKKAQALIYLYSGKSSEIKSHSSKFIKLPKEEAENYNNLIEYVKIFDRSEYLYSGVLYHDKIFINDIMLYHLTNRYPATKYHELHPGQATEASVQQEIIAQLQSKKPPVIVLYYNKESEKQKIIGENYLDEYIRENYILSKIFGNYYLFRINKE
ncbi:MAG TPA: glycosyltransferase family 39 protein [Candidatus Kapabacteria bacterium]|mgnify:FL=1|nr:glycosyltransferase family 39 protein [Candidatus Kapabacteria bacterium]HOM04078.1 glycosyltransferase family 39 protein [Candidatus Kapabacteria bacterium]HPP38971.1 glycosyltransferase family 39 protein [Candidatus Kapabacteria bacterium]